MAKKDSYSQLLKQEFINLFETLELNDRQKHKVHKVLNKTRFRLNILNQFLHVFLVLLVW
ncbi:MAG: hypothetical protein ACK5CG_13760 [Aphanizomenon sp.]|nr:hypothetical protein [Aphanizomenon flos-aquae CP01]